MSTSTEQGNDGSSRRGESDALPPAELGCQRDPARHRVDDARRTDTHGLQAAPLDPGGGEDLLRRGGHEIEELVGGLPLAGTRPASDSAEHLAREVGNDHQHLVGADVDAEHVAEVAAEAEQTGTRTRAPRHGVEAGDAFRQIPGLEQELHRAVDRWFGEAGHPGQLGAGDGPVGADRA